MFNFTLSEILRGRWFVDKSWADAQVPIVISLMKKESVQFMQQSAQQRIDKAFAVDPKTMDQFPLYVYDWETNSFLYNKDIPEMSVGVMPITGPVTKYNAAECGADGAIEKNNQLQDIKRHPAIGSVVLMVDTPGGESRAAQTLLPTIKNFGKPVFSYVDGISASLGVWYTSNTDEVYLGDELNQIGSVGSYSTLFDFSGMLESAGIKVHEIYAPQSTEKNKDYREAMNGNYSRIEDDLRRHVDAFIASVSTGGNAKRASRAARNRSKWDAGQMYYAEDAVKYGLADGIRPFDQVVAKAAWTAKRQQHK